MPATTLSPNSEISVLIPGIGAGSLGLEIYKALRHAGGYRLIGTDISETAYGLYGEGFANTYLLRRSAPKEYAQQLLEIALKEKVQAIAPGAEEVHRILAAAARKQGLAKVIAILALQSTVLLEPFHAIGVEHFTPEVGIVSG